jgi:glucose-1-phosphate thymidylyltransferase
MAGLRQGYIVLRQGKEDIPRTLGSGASVAGGGLDLAYLWVEGSGSVPETLDRAWPYLRHRRVALGFPDTLFEPHDAFRQLLADLDLHGADIVLGLFPAEHPETTDMVALDDGGTIQAIEVRPQATSLTFNWLLAVWSAPFTAFLHTQVAHHREHRTADTRELKMGHLFQRALAAGFTLRGVPFPEGRYVDIGSPAP